MLRAKKNRFVVWCNLSRNLPLWFLVTTFPLVVLGAYASTTTFENDLAKWPSPSTNVRRQIEEFQQKFESTDVLLVSWDGCRIDDPRFRSVRNELLDRFQSEYIENVSDGLSILRILTEKLDLSDSQARKRLQGSFLGQDGVSTSFFVSLTEAGSQNRSKLIKSLIQLLVKNGVPEHSIKFAGPAFHLYCIDMEGFWSPLRAVPIIASLSMLIVWFFLKRFKLALFISAMSGYTGSLALTIVYLSGVKLNALVWTMPTLVLLLTTSAALHFFGYYRRAVSSVGLNDAHKIAFENAWRPIVYCSLTTAVGLFSLILSDMTPVQEFGLYGGISVLASSCIVLACLPNWLRLFPYDLELSHTFSRQKVIWQRLSIATTTHRRPVVVIIFILAILLLTAIPRIKTSTHINNFFPQSSKIIQDAFWFHENLGGQNSVELLLTFNDASEKNDTDRIRMLEYLQHKYYSLENVTGVVSAATYAPRRHRKRKNIGSILRRRTTDAQIQEIKRDLIAAGLICQSNLSETWRVSLRIFEKENSSVADLVERIEKTAMETFDGINQTHFVGESLSVSSTGQAVLFEFVEQQFLKDLVMTYTTAFVLITIVVYLIMGNFVFVGVATPPNLLPAVLVLGGVAASNQYLDVGSLMTASVALGIAVDDTLHFVLWWRERVRSGDSNQQAIVDSMQHCGTAMFQTTIVCGISIALYAFCGFLPTVRFGLLLSAMLFAALVGDLLLLPALLATRFGRWIVYRLREQSC